MLKGETVYVNGEAVDNVLVEPGEAQDAANVSDEKLPMGTVVAYTLRFPISYEGPIHDAKIIVRGVECDTRGYADHYRPGERFGYWNSEHDMTVLVTRRLGDFSVTVQVVKLTSTIDELGDPQTTREVVYEGVAQARLSTGDKTDGTSTDTDTSESWYFVIPWQDVFGDLRPSITRLVMDDVEYDVELIDNVEMKSEYASFRAVRHG